MTSQLTPQQLLEIARVILPDTDWRIFKWKGRDQVCEVIDTKYSDTQMGKEWNPFKFKAHAVDLQIYLLTLGYLDVRYNRLSDKYLVFFDQHCGLSNFAKEDTLIECLTSLAHEVLCK